MAMGWHSKKGYYFNVSRAIWKIMQTVPKLLGDEAYECPACNRRGRMLGFGYPPRLNAMCPYCGSLERHRLLTLWFSQNQDLTSDKSVLHFAPEQLIGDILKPRVRHYTSAEFIKGKADIQLDIQDIALDNCSFDLVICLHILEHVDDRKALRELHRILTPGGIAILMFPIVEGWETTLESKDVPGMATTERDRVRYFGQHDHIRLYGRDVRDRIRDAGFSLREIVACEPEVSKYALLRGETIFIATKPNG